MTELEKPCTVEEAKGIAKKLF